MTREHIWQRSGPASLLLAWLSVATPLEAQAQAAQAPSVPSRDDITSRLADLRRIHTPEGIEVLEEVPIGGTKQWVSIRGLNKANPVILFIHGGPGTPMLPMTWAYQAPWEDFFTIVQWDQRGVGKNAVTSDREALTPTMTVERIIADAEEMVAWVRRRLGKEKIVVMGYSFGSMIGLNVAHRRPEWLHAFVGVGQGSGSGEDYLYRRLLELATKAGNQDALKELQSVAPYPGTNPPMADILLVRKWARVFNGGWYGKPTFDLLFALPDWAPEYTQADVDAQRAATQWASRALTVGRDRSSLQTITELKVPFVVMMGRHDLHTPYEPAKALFDRMRAPHKRFITFERGAHVPMMEEPGLFLLKLVEEVLPLTEGRAAFPPPGP